MFIQHLRRCEIEILLRDMHPPLSERVHPGFRADTFQLGAGAPIHLLGDLGEVDAAGEVHGAAVDAKDVGTGFNAEGMLVAGGAVE